MLLANLLFACVVQTPTGVAGMDQWRDTELPSLVAFYKELHQSPELSFQEEQTAGKMAAVLDKHGFEVIEGIGGFGVAGVLRNGPGPVVMVRADMDGLPILEDTDLPYSSKVTATEADGRTVAVMHACGHDVHMSVWAGCASFLAANREAWSGTLLFVAQPAEERGAGARLMLADRLFERTVTPNFCLGFHVAPDLPAGVIGSCSGYALANVDSVDIKVLGLGGHGSTPEKTHDPIALAARIVMGLQTLISREVAPQDPAVVTVGSIHGGTKHNIIPDHVDLQLTVRSYKPGVRQQLLDGIRRVAINEARAAGFPEELMPLVKVKDEHTPSAFNDPELVTRVNQTLKSVLGADRLVLVPPVMGGEDFGRYGPAADAPGYLMWLGACERGLWDEAQKEGAAALPGLHTKDFAPDPLPAIATGVEAMCAAVISLLPV